jgi:hypothetical protein
MDTFGINLMQRYLGGVTDIAGVICLLLAVSFSLTSGIPYPPSLAQVTLLYRSSTLQLATIKVHSKY